MGRKLGVRHSGSCCGRAHAPGPPRDAQRGGPSGRASDGHAGDNLGIRAWHTLRAEARRPPLPESLRTDSRAHASKRYPARRAERTRPGRPRGRNAGIRAWHTLRAKARRPPLPESLRTDSRAHASKKYPARRAERTRPGRPAGGTQASAPGTPCGRRRGVHRFQSRCGRTPTPTPPRNTQRGGPSGRAPDGPPAEPRHPRLERPAGRGHVSWEPVTAAVCAGTDDVPRRARDSGCARRPRRGPCP